MSPRRNRRREPKLSSRKGADSGVGPQRMESWPDGEWVVRPVTGSAATKFYRCPGCDQEIRPGVPHVVAWPVDTWGGAGGGVEDRRHWHQACWNARMHRGPRTRRPNNGLWY